MPVVVKVYGTRFCPYCIRARMLLDSKGVAYEDIRVDQDVALRKKMLELSGRHKVPQIWIDDTHVGGCSELYRLEVDGHLDLLLGLD